MKCHCCLVFGPLISVEFLQWIISIIGSFLFLSDCFFWFSHCFHISVCIVRSWVHLHMYLCALTSANWRFCWRRKMSEGGSKKGLKKYMKKHVWKTALTIQRQLRGRRDCLVQYFTSSRSKFCTAQPYFNFIAVLFKTKKKKGKKKPNKLSLGWKTNSSSEYPGTALNLPVPFGLLDTVTFMSLSYLYPFFCKVRPSCFVLGFFAWKGTECHKLPFPVISNLRWKTHWVAHRLLTSRHTHFQSTVFLCEQFKLHSYLSLENGFLYIFLVCQCLGGFLFFVLWNHFDILKLSAFSITFVELK